MRTKQLFFLFFITALLFACRRQAKTGDGQPLNYVPFADEALGLSLMYPESWIVHNAIGGLTVASDQSVIDGQSLAEIGDNGFVNIIPGELGIFNLQTGQDFQKDDALPMLGVYKQLLERAGQSYQEVEAPEAFTIEGQSAARMVVRSSEGGGALVTILAVVINDEFMALVSAGSLESTAAEMRPIFDEIVGSIQVTVPESLQ